MDDRTFMEAAVSEAKKSVAEDEAPRPKVAAIAASAEGLEIARAYRGELSAGEHAEYTLLETKASQATFARGTIFTTLEPCTSRNHPKVPCVERLIDRKPARVVIGMLDPNPNILGRGVRRLREARIEVEFFPADLMIELEETNRDFLRAHPLPPIVTEDLHAVLREQSLDDWYSQINRTYWNRNFQRDASAIFMHLVEVLGSLSLLVTKKEKPFVDAGRVYGFMAKAFAWWLALSGKVGIGSVAAMLWLKFPNVCPYCRERSHSPNICSRNKKAQRGPDWDALRELGKQNIEFQPKSLGAWQRMFNKIYATHNEDYPMIFAKLAEEMGELAEALRTFPSEPGIFLSESSDVFAWLMKLMNLFESQEFGLDADERGKALEDALACAYPRRCTDCHALICSCPPILPTTIGRLAHEVPGKLVSYNESGLFLTPERLSKLMGRV